MSRVRISVEDNYNGTVEVELEGHGHGDDVVQQLLDAATSKIRRAYGMDAP